MHEIGGDIPKEIKTPNLTDFPEITLDRMWLLNAIPLVRKFSKEEEASSTRVDTFLRKEDWKKENKQFDKYFTEAQDWKLYLDITREWGYFDQSELKNDQVYGGAIYYKAATEWIDTKTKDIVDINEKNKTKLKLKHQTLVFPDKKDWTSQLDTIEDWKDKQQSIPELTSLSIDEMSSTLKGRFFIKKFYAWNKDQTKNLALNEKQLLQKSNLQKIQNKTIS